MATDSISILLVEDNLINQKVAMKLLEKIGYKADIADNGAKAIEALDKAAYDLIFMDIQMPVMDGLQATSKIREKYGQHGSGGPIIIALTANVLPEDRENCQQAGMDDFIPKPVKKETIASTISKWFAA